MRLFSLYPLLLASSLLTAQPLTQEQIVQKGDEVSIKLLQLLSGELKTQMQTAGPLGALHFCSTSALNLTDQVAKETKTSIRRVSLNNRNPINTPTTNEVSLLNEWDTLAQKKQLLPTHLLIKTSENTTMYYKPIMINSEACLKCHGKVEGDLAKAIAATYPEDKATGYKMGDLRGMIAITIEHTR